MQQEDDIKNPIRSRYLADRVLIMLLYSAPIDSVLVREPREDGQPLKVSVRLSPFARSIRLNTTRLLDQISWLHTMGLITKVDLISKYGWATLTIREPGAPDRPTSGSKVASGKEPDHV
jgi:hypothetical protein